MKKKMWKTKINKRQITCPATMGENVTEVEKGVWTSDQQKPPMVIRITVESQRISDSHWLCIFGDIITVS